MSSVNWSKYHSASEVKAKLRHNDKKSRIARSEGSYSRNKRHGRMSGMGTSASM